MPVYGGTGVKIPNYSEVFYQYPIYLCIEKINKNPQEIRGYQKSKNEINIIGRKIFMTFVIACRILYTGGKTF